MSQVLAKNPPKKPNRSINWDLAKALALSGLTYKDIAKKLNCAEITIKIQAGRQGWSQLRQTANRELALKLNEERVVTLLERGREAQKQLMGNAEQMVKVLLAQPIPNNILAMDLHEDVALKLTKRVLLTSGLDQEQVRANSCVNIESLSMIVGQDRPCLEAEIVTEPCNKPQLTDAQAETGTSTVQGEGQAQDKSMLQDPGQGQP